MKHYSLNQKNLIINEITSKGCCIINDVFLKNETKKYKVVREPGGTLISEKMFLISHRMQPESKTK